MSTVLWCELEGLDDASLDLSAMYRHLPVLDEICDTSSTAQISRLIDNSDLEFNISEEDLGEEWLEANANWRSPLEFEATLICIREQLPERARAFGLRSSDLEALINELNYVIEKFESAKHRRVRMRLLAVM